MASTLHTGVNPRFRRTDRWLFVGVAAAIVVFVFAGFSPTFYLHQLFGQPAPTPFFVFHGLLMSGWVLLLLVQTTLIARGRAIWHRRLGIFGACYAGLIVVVGCAATLIAAAREVRAHSAYVASQLDVLSLELTQMLLFACLVGSAVWFRYRRDWHNRLMLLATLCILPNVIVRLSLRTTIALLQQNITLLSMWSLLVLAVVGLDAWRLRRLHPVSGFAGAMAIASLYAAYFIGLTQPWMRFASRLVS
jgi:hypothetical protein